MSKAFVKNDSDDEELPGAAETDRSGLPHGAKNYITPAGFKKLQDELRELKTKIRPEVTEIVSWAASNGDRSENGDYLYGKKKLREIDRRIRFLSKRLDISEIVDPLTVVKKDRIFFGATVVIRDEEGIEKTYRIVGVDEMDIEKGKISWVSPLANALFKAQVDDVVLFKSPRGVREIEILEIRYEALD